MSMGMNMNIDTDRDMDKYIETFSHGTDVDPVTDMDSYQDLDMNVDNMDTSHEHTCTKVAMHSAATKYYVE